MPRGQRGILVAALILAIGYAWLRGAFVPLNAIADERPVAVEGTGVATFAAGCFWSAESAFEGTPVSSRSSLDTPAEASRIRPTNRCRRVRPVMRRLSKSGSIPRRSRMPICSIASGTRWTCLLRTSSSATWAISIDLPSLLTIRHSTTRRSRHAGTGRNTSGDRSASVSKPPVRSFAPSLTIRTTQAETRSSTGSTGGSAAATRACGRSGSDRGREACRHHVRPSRDYT